MLAAAMNWVERIAPVIRIARGPHVGDLRLDRRKIFILPTRAGLMFGLLLIIMLLTSVNYALSLGYALTFLLVGVGLVSMLHTWRNLLGLTLRAGRAEPVHAGELAELGLILHNTKGRARYAIELTVPGNAQSTLIDVEAGVDQLIDVALPTDRRGWQTAPRMRLSTRWPLGLWQAWAWWHPQVRVLVRHGGWPGRPWREAGGTICWCSNSRGAAAGSCGLNGRPCRRCCRQKIDSRG